MEIKAQASFSHILKMEHNDSLKPQTQPSLSSLRKTTGKLMKYFLYGNIFSTDKTRAVPCKAQLFISRQLVWELSALNMCHVYLCKILWSKSFDMNYMTDNRKMAEKVSGFLALVL